MKLQSLNLRNFRTYRSLGISFHEKFNLIYGNNAQGKTNLLEAVYFICSFRPFSSVKNEDLITFGEQNAGIKGEMSSDRGLDEISIIISRGKKSVKLNGKTVHRLSSHIGRFNVVLFLPADLKIVKGAPGIRRSYLDGLICNLRMDHVKDLKDYNKTISQRNAVLSKHEKINSDMLEVWDRTIAQTGAKITERRLNVLKTLGGKVNELYNSTSGVNAKIDISYRPSYVQRGGVEESIFQALRDNFNRDRLRGHTTIGPHRDYIGFGIDDNDSTTYASQGESKNLVLALKAAEIFMYETVKGQKPILLLDDITSELDKNRKGFLFSLLKDYAGQVFVTSTAVDEIPYPGEKKVFKITRGRAEVIN